MLINNANITGSLIVVGGTVLSGSLTVSGSTLNNLSASYALTASYVASVANLSTFQIATGSVTASVNINSGSFTVASGSTAFFFITSSGEVLINGSVAQNVAASRGNLTINGSTSILNLATSNTNAGYLFHGGTDMLMVNAKNGALTFATNNTERARIDSSGRFGIGINAPSASLQVGNATSNTFNRSTVAILSAASSSAVLNALALVNSATAANGNGTAINFHNADNYSPTAKIEAVQDAGTSASLRFHTHDSALTEKMRINSSGSVGIGKTSPNARLDVSGSTIISGSLTVSGSTTLTGSLAVSSLTGSGVRYLVTDGTGNVTAQTASAAIRNSQAYTASAGQTTFTVTNGYTTGLVDVYLNGTKLLDGPEYTDTSGTNIVLTTGSFAGDIVEVVTYQPASGVTNNSLRQLTSFTATEGQTTFSASYVPGLLDVFYNGSRLNTIEYTAANGNSITLATGSAAGDLVDVLVYSYQVGAFSGIGGTGTANQLAYWNTTNSITGSPNFTVSGSTLIVTGSFTVSTGSAIELQVTNTGVNIGNVLTDSHIISGSLRVNPNGLFVSSSGIVGIGTSNPSFTLDVTGTGRFSSNLTTNGLYLISGNAIRTYRGANDYYWQINSDSNNFLNFGTYFANGTAYGTNPKLLLHDNGNVGIGTNNPDNLLEVYGTGTNTTRIRVRGTTNFALFQAQNDSSSAFYLGIDSSTASGFNVGNYSRIIWSGGAYPLVFATNDAERMRITSGGYLKASNAGTYSSATGNYHEILQSGIGSAIGILSHTAGSPYGLEVAFTGADPNNATNYMLGMYTTSPSFVWIYRIWSNGTVSARSDARWKKNIETTRSGYLEDLCKLRVVKYNWYNHEEDAPKELGLIAQEVEEVFPNLVQYDKVTTKKQVEQEDGSFIEQEVEDGESRSIKTSVLPYMLLKALQEANAKITALEEKLERNNIQ